MKKRVTFLAVLLAVVSMIGAVPADASGTNIELDWDGPLVTLSVTCEGGQTGTGTLFEPTLWEIIGAAAQFCDLFATPE